MRAANQQDAAGFDHHQQRAQLVTGLLARFGQPIRNDTGSLDWPCPICDNHPSATVHVPAEGLNGSGGSCSQCKASLPRILTALDGTAPDRPEGGPGGLVVRAEAFSAIQMERARWLWAGRIPLGAVTLLVGREKLGKSTLTCELAGRLSRGTLDGELHGQPAAALLVSFEDVAKWTVKPRLLAAGADVDRVHRVVVTRDGVEDLLSLPTHTEQIGGLARDTGARLLVIDPFSAALASEVDGHRDQHVRRALAPLSAIAEREDLAIVLVAHWNKSQGGDPLSRVLGSRGITAAVRSVLAFGIEADAEDRSPDRVLAHAACNLAREAPSLACRIEPRHVVADGQANDTLQLVLGDETGTSAGDLLRERQDDSEPSALDEAKEFLLAELAGGAHTAKQVQAAARDCGISAATLRRARDELRIVPRKTSGTGPWEWPLPRCSSADEHLGLALDEHLGTSPVVTGDSMGATDQGAHVSESEHLGRNGPRQHDPECCCETPAELAGNGRCSRCHGRLPVTL